MKTAKHVVGILAAIFGVIANIGGWQAQGLAGMGNEAFNELGVYQLISSWFTLLSITLWIVLIVLMAIPTKKKSVAKK